MVGLDEIEAQRKIISIHPKRSVALGYGHVEVGSRVEAASSGACIAGLLYDKRATVRGASVAITA